MGCLSFILAIFSPIDPIACHQNWQEIATSNASIEALLVFEDGGNKSLIVGGEFTTIGGISAQGIAKLAGGSWSSLGSSFPHFSDVGPEVLALASFQRHGIGSELYAAGYFPALAGSVGQTYSVLRWDGNGWNFLNACIPDETDEWCVIASNGVIYTLAVFDDGNGEALYAGGYFRGTDTNGAITNNIVKWDGTSWCSLGSGIGGEFSAVLALAVFDDGNGRALYAGGNFDQAGGVEARNLAKWDGKSWTALGFDKVSVYGSVNALAVIEDNRGSALIAGGDFLSPSQGFYNLARFDGTEWQLESPVRPTRYTATVLSLLTMDNECESGSTLYAGGFFQDQKGSESDGVTRYENGVLITMPSPLYRAVSLTQFDDGTGIGLFAAGDSALARWRHPCPHCDWNGNGLIDLGDFAVFSECANGPDIAIQAGCEELRLNPDSAIDLFDFAIFQNHFAGS